MTDTDTLATLLILTSALLHASWNAATKRTENKLGTIAFMSIFGSLLYIPFVPFFPLPHGVMWAFIFASVTAHIVYQLALARALELGDLTFIYPIARGLGPLLVGIFSLLFLSGTLSLPEFLAILTLVGGIFLTISARAGSAKAFIAAVISGVMIATYTLVDGFAVKSVDEPMIFIIWGALTFSPIFAAYLTLIHGRSFLKDSLSTWRISLPIALLAQSGYALALYALSLGDIGEIAALRETSIVFATLIGALWLKEDIPDKKMIAVLLIAIGAISLKLV
ncbi:EamA family transporter [Kordiimonas sp.]|uniref:EamA family transporter n=1 Tax=Kordiimonas sp. TaxID=1970157 RepID=UPI003A920DCB